MMRTIMIFTLFNSYFSLAQNDLNADLFLYDLIDYTKTPIYKKIKKHPEQYEYLDSVNIFRINYKSDGLTITGFMVAPKSEGNFPVVVFNRGGNRNYGQLLVGHATDIFAPIAAEGYVVVASNYRGNSGSEGVEEFGGSDVNDVINLAKLSSHYPGADTSKMGMIGISRGGMMNYLAMKKAKSENISLKCVISIGGITDLERTINHHPEIGTVCEEIVPDFLTARDAALISRSAIYWVNELPRDCPVLILHSFDDAAVTYEQIPPFADSLEKHEIPYRMVSFKNDNHGIMDYQAMVLKEISFWLRANLKQEKIEIIEKRTVVD